MAWCALAAAVLASGCGDDAGSPTATSPPPSGTQSERCLVRLHGKGGAGDEPATTEGVTILAPTGNAEGWGGRQWLYFPDDEYERARVVVADAIEGCANVIVNGFSNGGSFAAKLYCRGETFDGRLGGVVVDDPVVDAAVDDCTPAPDVALTLYWTGALDATAQPGWDCAEADWTCEGGTTIGIDAYAAALSTVPKDSPFAEHEWFLDAPEVTAW